MKIIGISGKKQVGKTTASSIIKELLEEENYTVVILSFATPIKQMVSKIVGCTIEDLDREEVKTKELKDLKQYWVIESDGSKLGPFENSYIQTKELHRSIMRDMDGTQDTSISYPTPRTLLQTIGTEVARNIHPDIWIKAIKTTIEQYKDTDSPKLVFIINDVRFGNEAAFIEQEGGSVLRIAKTSETSTFEDRHSSEIALDGYLFENVILNTKSMGFFGTNIRRFLVTIGLLT